MVVKTMISQGIKQKTKHGQEKFENAVEILHIFSKQLQTTQLCSYVDAYNKFCGSSHKFIL